MLKYGAQATKAGLLSAVIAAALAGCSPYPGEGRLDTSQITENAKIFDIRGEVYGVKPDAIEKANMLQADRDQIMGFASEDTQRLLVNGEPAPEFNLVYPETDQMPDMSQFEAIVVDNIEAVIAANKATWEAQVAEAEAALAELQAKGAELSKVTAKFDAAIADEQKALKTAEAELDSAIESYNKVINSAEEDINALALPKNLTDIRRYSNPVTKYSYVNYKDRGQAVPSSCPSQRGRVTVDLRSEMSSCIFIRLPGDYDAIQSQVVKITKQGIIDLAAASERLGQKGGWSRKPTGAYLAVRNAEQALDSAKKQARAEFGNMRQQRYAIQRNDRDVARAEAQVAELKSDEFRINALTGKHYDYNVYRRYDDKTADELYRAYRDAMVADARQSIVKLAPLEFQPENETAVFSGIDGGYDALIVLADVIAEKGNRRRPATMMQYVNLTDPAVQDADEIVVEFNRQSLSNAGRIDRDDSNEVQWKLIQRVRTDVQELLGQENSSA